MSYIKLEAIVVSSWSRSLLSEAHDKAKDLGLYVSSIGQQRLNGYRSFLIEPEASKERCEDREEFERKQDDFVAWCEAQRHDDGSSSISWVRVRFGGDDASREIVQ